MSDTKIDSNALNYSSLLVNPTIRNAVRGMAKKWNPSSLLAKKVRDFYIDRPRSNYVPSDSELELYLQSQQFNAAEVGLSVMLKNKFEHIEESGIDTYIESFFSKCRYDVIVGIQHSYEDERKEDEHEALLTYVKRISEMGNMSSKRLNVINFNEIDMEKFIDEEINAPKRMIKSQFGFVKELSDNGAYEKGWLVQVVAPTSCGKTLWLLNEAIYFAENGLRVFWVALGDMTKRKMIERALCIITETDRTEVTSKFSTLIKDPHVKRVLNNIDFDFEHASQLTSSDVVNGILSHEAGGAPYDVVIVDYDDNMKSEKESMYLEGGNSYDDLVSLAQGNMESSTPNYRLVFVAAQAKPALWSREELPKECAACSSQKTMKADMTIVINKNQNVHHVGTMGIVKHREGKEGYAKYIREEFGLFRGIDKREYDAIVCRQAYNNTVDMSAVGAGLMVGVA